MSRRRSSSSNNQRAHTGAEVWQRTSWKRDGRWECRRMNFLHFVSFPTKRWVGPGGMLGTGGARFGGEVGVREGGCAIICPAPQQAADQATHPDTSPPPQTAARRRGPCRQRRCCRATTTMTTTMLTTMMTTGECGQPGPCPTGRGRWWRGGRPCHSKT